MCKLTPDKIVFDSRNFCCDGICLIFCTSTTFLMDYSNECDVSEWKISEILVGWVVWTK